MVKGGSVASQVGKAVAAAQAFSIAEQEWGESALQVASAQVSSSCICICSAHGPRPPLANAKAVGVAMSTALLEGGLLLLKHLHALFAARGSGAIWSARGSGELSSVLFKYRGERGGYAPLVHLLAVASKGG